MGSEFECLVFKYPLYWGSEFQASQVFKWLKLLFNWCPKTFQKTCRHFWSGIQMPFEQRTDF